MAIYRGIGGASSTSDQATIDAVTTQATNAATSATNAASSASAASTSASQAASSASAASSSASAAASSATSAASSATSAANTYDQFDDRYLGSKTSDPATDNDGDALLTGALYFNSSEGEMRVYNGSAWVAAYVSLGDALLNIVEDDTPQLGGTLDANGNNIDMGTNLITDTKVGQWDTAYGWGDHSAEGYLTAEVNDLTAAVIWANVPDANITQSSVTQHQAALSITEGQISNLGSDIVLDSDIGVTVQGYDVNTAKYNDTTANFTGTLQNSGSNVVTDADIGVTVQAYDATYVVDADIGVTVQAYDADILKADTADTITAPMRGTVTTDNDLSFDMNVTNNFKCTPTGNGTLTFTNITAGQSGNIWLDNSGGHVISAAATTYISSADLTTISTAGVYFVSYYSDGTNVMVSATPAVTSAGA